MSSNIRHRRQNTGKKGCFSKGKEKEDIKLWSTLRSPPDPELFPSLLGTVTVIWKGFGTPFLWLSERLLCGATAGGAGGNKPQNTKIKLAFFSIGCKESPSRLPGPMAAEG